MSDHNIEKFRSMAFHLTSGYSTQKGRKDFFDMSDHNIEKFRSMAFHLTPGYSKQIGRKV
jgi:Zn/Cd-binding protein ZinT